MNKLKYILVALFAIFYSPIMGQNSDSIKSEHSNVLPKDSLSTQMYEVDSLKSRIKMMQIEITEKEKQISLLKNRLMFADSCFLRISNDCLRKKYDPVRVNEAIANFQKMYSKKLQETFSPLKLLLENYKVYYNEIFMTFKSIESDKEVLNLFSFQDAVKNSIARIKTTSYYRKVYSSNWTIMFLNDKIDEAIRRLETHARIADKNKAKAKEPVKLMDLLN